MLKHAYLIMAYSEYEQLNLLLKMLDYPGNDIYVHIDRKSPEPDRDSLLKGIKYSKVYIYQNYKVYWGDFSQTACEVFLLEEAIKNGYDYYHLLSGGISVQMLSMAETVSSASEISENEQKKNS